MQNVTCTDNFSRHIKGGGGGWGAGIIFHRQQTLFGNEEKNKEQNNFQSTNLEFLNFPLMFALP